MDVKKNNFLFGCVVFLFYICRIILNIIIMKRVLILMSIGLLLTACSKKIDDLECVCEVVSIKKPVYNFNEANLGEVIIKDKYGKLHTFDFKSTGVASIINQEVGYKFGGIHTNNIQQDTLKSN